MDLLVEKIYHDVFSKIQKGNVDLFLCGAASTKKKTSYRDQFKEKIESFKRISVLYPEELFMEMLSRKKYDLLTLEKLLAKNCDYIAIVCESPGSFTELGAFVNNSETVDKVIVLLQTKYKNAKSFICQGPVQYVLSRNKNHVIYYNTDIEDAALEIRKLLLPKYMFYSKANISFKDLDTITGQYNFVLLLLYFFKVIKVKDLNDSIKGLYNYRSFTSNEFDMVYSSAIRRLFKDGLLAKSSSDKDESRYQLTRKGYMGALELLSYAQIKNRTSLYNGIRMKIMKNGGNN